MDRKILLPLIAAASLGSLGFWLLMPPSDLEDEIPRLPWLVEQDGAGHIQVFGFTLGKTTLAQIRAFFREEGKINLFASLDARGQPVEYTVEAYFDRIYLQGLRGDFIFTLATDADQLAPLYERGLRISQLPSGAKKVDLNPADLETLLQVPIRSLTYLPWKSLDADILNRRFGPPAEKRREPKTGVEHWLYPQKGMDIAMDPQGRVVIQYLNPADFTKALAPLRHESRTAPRPQAAE